MADTDYYTQQPEVAARVATTPQDKAKEWMDRIRGEDDETKDAILQEIWGKEGFRDA